MKVRCLAALAIPVLILISCSSPAPVFPLDVPQLNNEPTQVVDRSIPRQGLAFKGFPDSELVFSPATVGFDLHQFIQSSRGYLSQYVEEVQGERLRGAEILDRISREYSLNPRLLLSLLEYSSGWVTKAEPLGGRHDPFGLKDADRTGLYRQLSWAANTLNRGYYTRRVNALPQVTLPDGQLVDLSPALNAGSAAIQYFFSRLLNYREWELAVSPLGLYAVFTRLFGDPLAMSIDPLVPPGTQQPPLILPFVKGDVWHLSSGPHSAWGDGAAWAALDFIPPGRQYGCSQSRAWAVAAADGLVVRSGNGVVVLDLDKDGYEQTGWTLLYLHIATQDRVSFGAMLDAGSRIGHPSCEGGPSNGTHLHFARRYNGEWIPADQDLPFNLDGWISKGFGRQYDGRLQRGTEMVEAYGYITTESQISR